MRLPILAAALLAATPAMAQDAGSALTETEVRGFLEPLAGQAETAVNDSDWAGFETWFRDHLADDATVALDMNVIGSGGAASSLRLVLDGADVARFARMASDGSHGFAGRGAFADYTLEMTVAEVHTLPDGGATAMVRLHESGMLAGGPDVSETGSTAGGEPAGDGAGPGEGKVFAGSTNCALRLNRTDGAIVISAAACMSAAFM